MQIEPLGDNALLLRLETTQIDDAAVDALLDAARALENAALPGVIELAPAYTTLAVFYDPAAVQTMSAAELPFDVLAAQITRALRATSDAKLKVAAQTVEIPVCYGGTFGPDLEHVAQHAGIASEEVVKLHVAAVYRVSCIGFTPGFPYLAGLPSPLATPRRSSPRKEVAAGSVGIGGKQTGIYPAASPGGWNLIGRTPMRLFDPHRSAPALLRAGDTVRFRAITRAEFDELQAP